MKFSLMLGLFMLVSSISNAAVTTIQAFDFGEWVVKNNDAQHEITINTNGSYTYDSAGFIEISPPQEGIFDLDGMTPNTSIVSVVVTQFSPLSGSGIDFEMINFQETHSASTDGLGVARITVGGTARTSGAGGSYVDQTFNGIVQIQINF